MSRCLICTGETPDPSQYHPICLKKLFGSREKPELDIRSDQLQESAKKTVYQRVSVPGVQSRLSLEVEKKARGTSKLTIVGVWGRFILKPPSEMWPEFPENPLYDLTRYFDLVLFSYLTGNGDMHLKNFSLLREPQTGWKLAPAYDLLSTRLLIPAKKDPEELALTLTGKKSNFKRDSFMEFGQSIGLERKQVITLVDNLVSKQDEFIETIEYSFMSREKKELFRAILAGRLTNL
ncbi:MAG: HipA domain-containing protein [Cyclonatronaceae bacterium]